VPDRKAERIEMTFHAQGITANSQYYFNIHPIIPLAVRCRDIHVYFGINVWQSVLIRLVKLICCETYVNLIKLG